MQSGPGVDRRARLLPEEPSVLSHSQLAFSCSEWGEHT